MEKFFKKTNRMKIKFEDLITFFYILAIFVMENEKYSSWFSFIQIVFFLTFFLKILVRKRLVINMVYVWLFSVIIITSIVLLFNLSSEVITSSLIVLKNGLKVFCILVYLQDNSPYKLILMIGISGLVCGSALLLRFLDSNMVYDNLKYATNSRIGSDIAGGNVNIVALNMCFAFSSWLFFTQLDLKKYVTFISYLCLIFVAGTSLLTGSRKILLFFVSAFILAHTKLSVKNRMIGILGIIVLYISLMNIEPLYYLIGHKIDIFSGSDAYEMYDVSDESRWHLFLESLNVFINNPFGVGFGNVAHNLGVYAHNNYTEVLASIGIFGFISYYSIYFYSLLKVLKKRYDTLCNYIFYTLIGLMIVEFGQVTCYYSAFFIFIPITSKIMRKQVDM